MTASDVERRLTALLHDHAEEAMNQTDTPVALAKFHERVEQETKAGNKRRAVTGIGVLTAAAVGVGALWFGFQQDDAPSPTEPLPPAASPSQDPTPPQSPTPSETPPASETPGSTVQGFEGAEEFPMRYVVPAGFVDPTGEAGVRGYSIDGTSGDVAAFLVSTLAQTAPAELPDDLAAYLRRTRDELTVSNVGTSEVGDRPAQTFTLTQKPGTTPFDLLCARNGTCFKLLPEKPMDVTVVRTGEGLVLFWVEYLPEDRAEVQKPMQRWLDSVRWQ